MYAQYIYWPPCVGVGMCVRVWNQYVGAKTHTLVWVEISFWTWMRPEPALHSPYQEGKKQF